MGALKQMLIREKMRISEEWDSLKHYEYIIWKDKVQSQHYYTYKKELDIIVNSPPQSPPNKLM